KRSVPDNPVTRTSSPTRKLISAPANRVATNKMTQAVMTRAEGVLMKSTRCSASAPPNIHAMTPATIQISSESASLTKPRLRLIKPETAMTAMIDQSTQVKDTE